jgi:hypothetical protein
VDIWRRQNASCGIVLRFSSYSKFIPKTKFKLRNFSEIQKSIRKRSKVSTEVSKQDSKAQRLFQSIWHSTWRSKMFTLSLEILFHPRSDLSTMRLKEHDQKSTRVLLQPSNGKLFGAAQVFSEEWFILSAAESFTMIL